MVIRNEKTCLRKIMSIISLAQSYGLQWGRNGNGHGAHLPSRGWCRCSHWDDRRAWSPWDWSWRDWPPRWWHHRAVVWWHPATPSARRWRAAASPSRPLCLEHHLCHCNCVWFFFFFAGVSINNAVFLFIVYCLLVHKTRVRCWCVASSGVVVVVFGCCVCGYGIRYSEFGIRFSIFDIRFFVGTQRIEFWTQNPSVYFYLIYFFFGLVFLFLRKIKRKKEEKERIKLHRLKSEINELTQLRVSFSDLVSFLDHLIYNQIHSFRVLDWIVHIRKYMSICILKIFYTKCWCQLRDSIWRLLE